MLCIFYSSSYSLKIWWYGIHNCTVLQCLLITIRELNQQTTNKKKSLARYWIIKLTFNNKNEIKKQHIKKLQIPLSEFCIGTLERVTRILVWNPKQRCWRTVLAINFVYKARVIRVTSVSVCVQNSDFRYQGYKFPPDILTQNSNAPCFVAWTRKFKLVQIFMKSWTLDPWFGLLYLIYFLNTQQSFT